MATRPSICDGSVIAVAGRYSFAISSSSMKPCAKASSPKVPFGMSLTILKISTRSALSLASSSMPPTYV